MLNGDAYIHYSACPVCGSNDLVRVLTVKDYTVFQKEFPVLECKSCTLRLTQDVPSKETIGAYYQSEDYISHTNTSKGIINKLYKQVRAVTVGQKRKLITRQTGRKRGTILDIGAGTGFFLQEMKRNGWEVTGLEPDQQAREIARKECGLSLEPTDELFRLQTATFDAITLWHVLEHVHDLKAYLGVFHSILKNKGKLVIAVPNYTSHDASVYGRYWAAYDVPRHLYHFSPACITELMKRNGFRVDAIKPMWFDSFYVCFLSSRYKNGKVNWVGAAWSAFRSNVNALFDNSKCSSVIYVISKEA